MPARGAQSHRFAGVRGVVHWVTRIQHSLARMAYLWGSAPRCGGLPGRPAGRTEGRPRRRNRRSKKLPTEPVKRVGLNLARLLCVAMDLSSQCLVPRPPTIEFGRSRTEAHHRIECFFPTAESPQASTAFEVADKQLLSRS